jgi:hypothetical protein
MRSSFLTLCWREMDSNSRSPVSGDTPQRPRIASPGIISAKSRLALRTKGFDPFAEILRASPESHRFLAKVPAPRRRDPVPAFRKMRVQASDYSFPAYKRACCSPERSCANSRPPFSDWLALSTALTAAR